MASTDTRSGAKTIETALHQAVTKRRVSRWARLLAAYAVLLIAASPLHAAARLAPARTEPAAPAAGAEPLTGPPALIRDLTAQAPAAKPRALNEGRGASPSAAGGADASWGVLPPIPVAPGCDTDGAAARPAAMGFGKADGRCPAHLPTGPPLASAECGIA